MKRDKLLYVACSIVTCAFILYLLATTTTTAVNDIELLCITMAFIVVLTYVIKKIISFMKAINLIKKAKNNKNKRKGDNS